MLTLQAQTEIDFIMCYSDLIEGFCCTAQHSEHSEGMMGAKCAAPPQLTASCNCVTVTCYVNRPAFHHQYLSVSAHWWDCCTLPLHSAHTSTTYCNFVMTFLMMSLIQTNFLLKTICTCCTSNNHKLQPSRLRTCNGASVSQLHVGNQWTVSITGLKQADTEGDCDV